MESINVPNNFSFRVLSSSEKARQRARESSPVPGECIRYVWPVHIHWPYSKSYRVFVSLSYNELNIICFPGLFPCSECSKVYEDYESLRRYNFPTGKISYFDRSISIRQFRRFGDFSLSFTQILVERITGNFFRFCADDTTVGSNYPDLSSCD